MSSISDLCKMAEKAIFVICFGIFSSVSPQWTDCYFDFFSVTQDT